MSRIRRKTQNRRRAVYRVSDYRTRPEVPVSGHGVASDPTFWERWFAARRSEEEAEEREIAAAQAKCAAWRNQPGETE